MKNLLHLGVKLKELIIKNQFILYLMIFFTAFLAYLWIQSSPTFLDPDSFYHLKMAKLIAERGVILDFPWLQFTVLKDYYIDHHFLYHVAAIPFIKVFGDFAGFKLYTVILATLFIFLSYCFFKKEKLKYAEIYALIMIFTADFMFRISLAKASAFSLIILFAGIYFIFYKKYWLLFLGAYLYVLSYGGFPLLAVITLIYVFARAFDLTFINKIKFIEPAHVSLIKKVFKNFAVFLKNILSWESARIIAATLSGIFVGLILNPYFPKNLNFYWQQLVQIGIINFQGVVNVGGEWYPYEFLKLISDTGVLFIFGVVAFVLFFIFIKKQNAKSIFFLLAALFFLFLTLKSKRYIEYFVPFLDFFVAFTLGNILAEVKVKEFLQIFKKENYIIGLLLHFCLIYAAIIFPLIMMRDAYLTRQSFKGGIEFSRFSGISKYLLANSQPGQIVMQTDWDDWPMLFYYNDKDYYIVGLDPTFMYNYDPVLYNLFADITTTKKADDLYQIVKNTFKASYFIVDKDRFWLVQNLQNDGNFTKVYEDNDGSIYKLK
ncbi:MAG: hypothetical protein WC460_02525 [Patescibacteria group bacterium]